MTDLKWEWPGSRIVRTVDGDTLDALVTRDLGFGGTASFTVRLRLNRINAPALRSRAGHLASDWVAALLKDQIVDIVTVKPYAHGGPRTSPGEWMAEVTLPNGINVSDQLVTDGQAVYWDGKGARPNDGQELEAK